jgi:exonuclease III
MKIITWKIRGLKDLSKQREIRSLVTRFHIQLVCIVETRVKREKSMKIKVIYCQVGGLFRIMNIIKMTEFGFVGIQRF